jgi:acetolactate synthase-1/2/3 large subunit
MPTGGDILCRALEGAGVRHIFGLPGTQNIALFDSLRRSAIRTVAPTHELSAAFMANGYYRASGRPGVLTTIPGPGFAYTMAGIAEAAHDSAAVVYIAGAPRMRGRKFELQAIDQKAVLRPVVKEIFEIEDARDIGVTIAAAYQASLAGEPGPVLVHLDDAMIGDDCRGSLSEVALLSSSATAPDPAVVQELADLIAQSRRPLLFLGQGASDAAAPVRALAERLNLPVIATRSGRGIFPEDHQLALRFDFSRQSLRALNDLLDRSDLILALGCKLSHNGTFGFRMRLDQQKLIHVDTSPDVLNANYPTRLAICAPVESVLNALQSALPAGPSEWTAGELARFASRAVQARKVAEPRFANLNSSSAASFFDALMRVMPPDSCLVTDSGLHQVLAARHFVVRRERGFVIPSDFQSMGFALPAAIGAKLARPERTVVALVGDGGLAMSGLEMLTAVREKIPITAIVFNDGALGQIRLQQLSSYGSAFATEMEAPRLNLLAEALGMAYLFLRGDAEIGLRAAIDATASVLVEVELGDSARFRTEHVKGLVRAAARTTGLRSALTRIKGKLKR